MDIVFYKILMVLGTFFWVSSLYSKLTSFADFKTVIGNYDVVPLGVVPASAVIIICAEFMALVLLWLTPQWGGGASALLVLFYGFITAFNLLRGHVNYDCGCSWGARGANRITWNLVIRNIGLASIFALLLTPVGVRGMGLLDISNIIFAVVFVGLLTFAIGAMINNFEYQKDINHV